MERERHPPFAADRHGEEYDRRHEAYRNRDYRRFRSESASGQQIRARKRHRNDAFVAAATGDRRAKHATFGEVPAKMQADGQPEIAADRVSGGEKDTWPLPLPLNVTRMMQLT